MIKKTFISFLAIFLSVSLIACGKTQEVQEPTTEIPTVIEEITTEEETTEKKKPEQVIISTNMTKKEDYSSNFNMNVLSNSSIKGTYILSGGIQEGKEHEIADFGKATFTLEQEYIYEIYAQLDLEEAGEKAKQFVIYNLVQSTELKDDVFVNDFVSKAEEVPVFNAWEVQTDNYNYRVSKFPNMLMITITYIGTTEYEEPESEEKELEVGDQISVEGAYTEMKELSDNSATIKKTSSGYTFRNMAVVDSDVIDLMDTPVFELSTGFNCVAKILTNLCNTGGKDFVGCPEEFFEVLLGAPKPESWDAFKKHATKLNAFIKLNTSATEIMKTIEKTGFTSGTFNHKSFILDVTIDDLHEVSKTLGISEQMLGYALSVVQIKCMQQFEFDGNTVHIVN